MTTVRSIAVIAAALALVCRLTLNQFAFGFSTTATPGWHQPDGSSGLYCAQYDRLRTRVVTMKQHGGIRPE
jgi:hypothetical protein